MFRWIVDRALNAEGLFITGTVLGVSAVGETLLGGPAVVGIVFGVAASSALAAAITLAAVAHEHAERGARRDT